MAGVAAVPEGDVVRLPPASAAEHPDVDRSVRAADKPVQREDLHLRLVLAGGGVRVHQLQHGVVAVPGGVQAQPGRLHQEVPEDQQRAAHRLREEAVLQVRRAVPARRRCLRDAGHLEELDGPGRHRSRR